MYETSSLADKNIFSQTISLVVADIDYTLADFVRAHKTAINAIGKKMGESKK